MPTESEAIEIYNPTNTTIDLTTYRLYNANFTPTTDSGIPCHAWSHDDAGICGQRFSDFDLQFPPGFTIGPGQTKFIAIGSAGAFCGGACPIPGTPDFEIPAAGAAPNTVPDMLGVWISTATAGLLSDVSEDLTLYRWDGVSPLIEDIDYFFWGSTIPQRVNKTGVSGYRPDTPATSQRVKPTVSSTMLDYQRFCHNEPGERKSDGNGIGGHDETSEDMSTSWIAAPPSLGAKTANAVP